ncbi:MAG: DUF4365 domain-containing protein [Chloroflexi bacterium]|nr:DUF4365 domain-containing protein [Chloroflexota bacterium]
MVADALLPSEGREEALSNAYARSVAAAAGYTTADHDYDRSGTDLFVQAGGEFSPMLALQLKATVNLNPLKAMSGEVFSFRLKAANHEWLRRASQVPRLLVVLDMPKPEEDWITISTEELVLRRCAYWLNLHGASPSTASMPTVQIPKSQIFDVATLQMLMEESRKGSL